MPSLTPWIRPTHKMDNGLISSILEYSIAPVGAFLLWLHKKQSYRMDSIERRVANVEKSTAVIEAMVDNIREDLREIKRGIEKLVDRGNL